MDGCAVDELQALRTGSVLCWWTLHRCWRSLRSSPLQKLAAVGKEMLENDSVEWLLQDTGDTQILGDAAWRC